MAEGKLILVVNFGSTSTKLAIFKDSEALERLNHIHGREELDACRGAFDQLELRLAVVKSFLKDRGYRVEDLSAIAPRFGIPKFKHPGMQLVNEDFVQWVRERERTDHVLYICPVVAWELVKGTDVPVFVCDSSMWYDIPPEWKLTGVPSIMRETICHTDNVISAVNTAAERLGKPMEECSFIVVHMGGGISFSLVRGGRIRMALGDGEGSFTPERAGMLPAGGLIDLCYSGKYTQEEARKLIKSSGGIYAHLGTTDCIDVEDRAVAGEPEARLVYSALGYNLLMYIGQLAALAGGGVHRIILTGGLARSDYLVDIIKNHTAFIAPLEVLPGEAEMEYFAANALAVLEGCLKSVPFERA